MTGGRALTDTQFRRAVLDITASAFRAERQPLYVEEPEEELRRAFLRGDAEPPATIPFFQGWYDQVREHVQAGRRIGRVRIHSDPPSDYQRYERWLGIWNERAGEQIRYLTRERAGELGLLDDTCTDWWLLDAGQDHQRVIIMTFDAEGRRIANEMVTNPLTVQKATAWRDLALHHATGDGRGAAA